MGGLSTDQVDLRLLRSFVVLSEELHFGRAAKRLHLAQPTLSQQIQRLERQLGFAVLARSTRHVTLTPAGEALLEGASAALGSLNDSLEMAAARARTSPCQLAVGLGVIESKAFSLIGHLRRAGIVDRIDTVAPRDLFHAQDLVAQGDCDIGLVMWPPLVDELEFTVLGEDALYVAVPTTHPASTSAQIAPGDVIDLENCGPWSRLPRALIDYWAEPFGVDRGEPPWGPDVQSHASALELVAQGGCFFIVTSEFARENPRDGVSYRPTVGTRAIEWGVAHRRTEARDFVHASVALAVELSTYRPATASREMATDLATGVEVT